MKFLKDKLYSESIDRRYNKHIIYHTRWKVQHSQPHLASSIGLLQGSTVLKPPHFYDTCLNR